VAAFGSAAIEFEMWFWIRDAAAGITNVKSDVLLALWDQLSNAGVRIPRPGPSRVIYEMAPPPTPVREDEPNPAADENDEPAPGTPRPPFPPR
jgi:small-conductance mechanosensitive channel